MNPALGPLADRIEALPLVVRVLVIERLEREVLIAGEAWRYVNGVWFPPKDYVSGPWPSDSLPRPLRSLDDGPRALPWMRIITVNYYADRGWQAIHEISADHRDDLALTEGTAATEARARAAAALRGKP